MKTLFKKYTSNTLGGSLLSICIVVVFFLISGVSYFYIYLPSSTNHGESITVPNIEGMHISELETFLVERSLRYEVNDSAYSDAATPLTILKQYPAAGTKVKEGRKIFISVNRVTPPTVPLPNLVDGSLINAEAVLRGNELKRGRIQLIRGPFFNLVKEMHFGGRKVEAGTRIPKGSTIDLVIEDGGSPDIPMADIVGYPLDEAKELIFGYNLHLGEIHVVGDTLSTGLVVILKQVPEPKQKLRAGDVVDVWVGKKGTPVPTETENELEQ
jgi:eukaryotic-like serine/threonine-protein kinase